jgi:hypothetical protein
MPIIITFKHSIDPRDRVIVQGASSDEFFARNDKGRIRVTYMNGHDGEVIKDMVRNVEIIPGVEWDKGLEDQKQKQADDLAEQEKNRAAAATLALLESKTFKGRVKRLFGKKP